MAKQTAVLSFSGQSSLKDFDLVQKPWAHKNPGKFSEWLEENVCHLQATTSCPWIGAGWLH